MKDLVLENKRVKLSLLTIENYTLLTKIAQEKDLIYYSPSDISSPKKLKNYVEIAIDNYNNNQAVPFIIYDKQEQTYSGSTRFGLINHKNKVLHIGWTWLGKEFQGTGLNKNIKFLMLQYAFETLNFDKVEFRIDERNVKSRNSVEKIGGILEGILRQDTLMLDGFKRSTCCYGILKIEWLLIKETLFGSL